MVDVYAVYYPIILSFVWASGAFLSRWKERDKKAIDEVKEKELFDKIKARYDEQVSPYYAASRLWTDAIIDPLETRNWISMGIEAANHAPIEKQFNLGVIQV